jgi:hypothetical protein
VTGCVVRALFNEQPTGTDPLGPFALLDAIGTLTSNAISAGGSVGLCRGAIGGCSKILLSAAGT